TVTVAAGSYTDVAGNSGGVGADTVTVDRFEAAAFTGDNLRFLINTTNENESTQGSGGQSLNSGADLGSFQSIGVPGSWTFTLARPSTSFHITGNALVTKTSF